MRFLQVRIPLGLAQFGLDQRPLVVGEVRWIPTARRRILRFHIRFRSQPEETRKFLWNTFLDGVPHEVTRIGVEAPDHFV